MDQEDNTSVIVDTEPEEQQATPSTRTAPQPTSTAWASLAAPHTAAASKSRIPAMDAEAMQHSLLAAHSRISAMEAEAMGKERYMKPLEYKGEGHGDVTSINSRG